MKILIETIGEYVMCNQSKLNSAAYDQLNKDADRILHLIKVQMDNLTPSCPLYEGVLDTQMFGLQKEVDFAVQLGLVDKEDGKQLMLRLEKKNFLNCMKHLRMFKFLFVINCKNNVFTKLTVCIMYYV